MIEAWIYAKPAAWDALSPVEGVDKQIWRYPYLNAVTGFWNDYAGGHRVYNVIGVETALKALVNQLDESDLAQVFAWRQGAGMVSRSIWPPGANRAAVLAVMKDHVTYDVDGNPTGSTPATYENPNWGHVFLGQGTRIFAGGFSLGFSEGLR